MGCEKYLCDHSFQKRMRSVSKTRRPAKLFSLKSYFFSNFFFFFLQGRAAVCVIHYLGCTCSDASRLYKSDLPTLFRPRLLLAVYTKTEYTYTDTRTTHTDIYCCMSICSWLSRKWRFKLRRSSTFPLAYTSFTLTTSKTPSFTTPLAARQLSETA
jgi:hypothetical protein